MNNKYVFVLALLFSAASSTLCAYELPNHFDMSLAAAQKSVLGQPSTLANFGIDDPKKQFSSTSGVNDSHFTDTCSHGNTFASLTLIACGAQFEDVPSSRSLNHFFDPSNGGKPLTVTPIGALGKPSPDWALKDNNNDTAQEFAYRDARDYFYRALTSQQQSQRDQSWGKVFQAIGQVIHHLQDMAQPQHVRNDGHCDAIFPCAIPGALIGAYNPSNYEKYTSSIPGGARQRVQNLANTASGNTIYPGSNNANISVFNTPRKFFVGAGRGIAEYTNSNFVSDKTNFTFNNGIVSTHPVYSQPIPGQANNPVSMPQLFPNGVPSFIQSACGLDPANCYLTFYSTTGTDPLTGSFFTNDRASTLSIFDADLQVPVQMTDPATGQQYTTQKAFALNRFNFDAAHGFLIPRAVSYSAGLINYFFRGKIDILPDPQNPGSHLVKNLGPEPMAGKFTLYYDTVDGNRQPVSDASGSPLVWDTRVILASSDGVLPPNTDMPVTGFIAPSDPAPKRVGEYMLVFAGDMGEEKADEASGVVGAVAAKFIEVTPGTLYLAAVDANNNYVGLRADKNGTKVLSGEFDPLAGLVIGQTFPKVQFFNIANAHTHKQVAFTQTVNGWSYQTLGFGLPLNRFSQLQVGYVWNALLNSFTQTSGRPWIAKSPDPTIGTFQFFFFNFSGKAFLNYNRQFVDSTGATRTTLGQVSLPDSTDLAFYLLDVGFISGELPVSPDGLHVGEFPVSTITTTGDIQCGSFQQVTNKQYYELLITLSATPTAQLNAVANITDTASGTSTCRFGSRLSIAESSHSTDRIFIGNFIGGKQIYIHTLDFSVSGSASTSVSGSDSSGWQRLCQENTDFFGNFQNQLAHTYQFPDGTLTGTITCNESVGRQYSGQPGVIGLSQHASDAIYTQPAPPSNPRYFRGTLLGEGFYIADASPLGEVFVATADLSVVIHDPLPGGMPKVVIPPGIVKLLAALWL